MEQKFCTIVEHVFQNWTGLQLAIEHGMGGPNSAQVADDFINYVARYCIENPNVPVEDIQEVLEDILDEEFETICEDNSPTEIAHILHRFLSLLKEGNVQQCEIEYQNLPKCNLQLSRPLIQQKPTQVGNTSTTEDTVPNTASTIPMDEDDEWTEVKSRKRK